MIRKGKEKVKGTIQLFKNDQLVREYNFQNTNDRKRMLSIWRSEIKLNGDCYYLIIKPELK
jgi:hypothetical protein